MAKIVITDVHKSYDGSYDLEPDALTHRDLHTIKRISGIRRNEIEESLIVGDSDLILAFAVVVLERAGVSPDEDILWNAQMGRVQLDMTEDIEQLPPPQTPHEQSSGDNENKTESKRSSGDDTETSSDSRANGQSLTGLPHLATPSSGPGFAPVISQGSHRDS